MRNSSILLGLCSLALLGAARDAHADGAALVKDLATAADRAPSSSPQPLAVTHSGLALVRIQGTNHAPIGGAPGTFYFSAVDARNGRELWKTDGTAAGTSIVMDINPGPTDSKFGAAADCNGTLVFVVSDGVHGAELWRSDGTAAGTFLLKDMSPGPADTAIGNMRMFNGKLYFDATPKSGTTQLWRTDGTVAGTELAPPMGNARVPSAGAVRETYWLTVNGASSLWESDGTPQGTRQVSESLPPRNGLAGQSPANGLLATKDRVYAWLFSSAANGYTENQLAVVDRKTKKITVIVDHINAEYGDGVLFEYRGKVYFDARSTSESWVNDVALWQTDGTAAGTQKFAAANGGPGSIGWRHGMFAHKGKMYFFETGAGGRDVLFVTDGTPGGTVQLTPWFTSNKIVIGTPRDAGSVLQFPVSRDNVSELWQTDGTPGGTHVVAGTPQGKNGSTWIRGVDGVAYTDENDGSGGLELWRLDGAKLSLVKDIAGDDGSSSPYPVGALGGKLLFGATTPQTGIELYTTDGTAAGTALLKDINAGAKDSTPGGLGVVNGKLLFVASEPTHGRELYSTDGTAAGTALLRDIKPGAGDSSISSAIVSGSKLVFAANDGTSGLELWSSDASASGTQLVKDICAGPHDSTPTQFAIAGSSIFFSASDCKTGVELWQTGATPSATTTVPTVDLRPNGDSTPSSIFAFGPDAYFAATDGKSGRELWVRRGSSTQLVKDINPGAKDANPQLFAVAGATFFFVADDGAHGPELWKSDGTSAGTVLVKDVRAGAAGSDVRDLVAIGGGVVLFTAHDGASGRELWRSDGTAAGTTIVKDIWPGDFSSTATGLVQVRPGVVVFAASDGVAGVELWRSDGTAAGTRIVQDLAPGAGSSNPLPLYVASGTTLFVSAYVPGVGREMYALPAGAI